MTAPPVVLVLAAGRGTRFLASGGSGHKLQALLHGQPVLQHTLHAVQASGLPWHLEQGQHASMGDSIVAAVQSCQFNAGGWLVLPADLPLILPQTLHAVAQALALHPVVVPVFAGQRGHPVGFAATCRAALLALHGAAGAAGVVRSMGHHVLAVEDAGSVTDVDTLPDLARAEALLQLRMSRI